MKIIKSKFLLSLILIITLLCSSLNTFALDLIFGEKVENPEVVIPIDKTKVLEHGTIVFEAEDIIQTNDNNASIMSDPKASGGKAVNMPNTKWEISATKSDEVYTKIYVDDPSDVGSFKLWLRTRSTHSDSGSLWLDPGTGVWAATYTSGLLDGEYRWSTRTINLNLGVNYIAFRTRTSGILDKIIVTNAMAYTPEGFGEPPEYLTPEEEEAQWRLLWEEPEIKPIEGHPRLLITKANKDKVKTYLEGNWRKDRFLGFAYDEINCKLDTTKANNHNAELLAKIMGRAFAWVLGYETNPQHAKQTIQHMKDYLTTLRTPDDAGDITRSRGNVLYTAAIVYDWCYDQLTKKDKDFFVAEMMKVVNSKEIGWPPKAMSDVTSHAGEQEIFRDLLGAGIALYDEYPLLYDLSAGRMFEKMVPSRKFFRSAGRVEYGHDYSLARGYSEAWADWQIQCMGYDSIYGDDIANRWWEWRIDARMPYGSMFPDGDMYSLGTRSRYRHYYVDYVLAMKLAANLYNNPTLNQEVSRYINNVNITNYDNFFYMLLTATTDNPKSQVWNERPLATKAVYPQSALIARTSWQEGFDSNAAAVFVDMHEIYVSDHQHQYTGDFQVYYKGLLAMTTGTYNASNQHNAGYSHRSIAANTVLVHDPNETFDAYWSKSNLKVANDGGQKLPYYGEFIRDWYEFKVESDGLVHNEDLIVAKDVKSYIGPNEVTPEFSYITGDLTTAYTAKVSDYHRSMVFMDLNNEEFPAAFVVYDKLTTSNPDFKKSWLLHSQEKPTIEGNTTIIERTQDGFGGRLVNKTLTPAKSNLEFKVVGGDNGEMFKTAVSDNAHKTTAIEAGKYRIEIGTKRPNKNDNFLNAMFVTDAGNTNELPMKKVDQGRFTGVMIMDKQVYFEKYAEKVSTSFNLSVKNNGYGENSVLVGGVAPGVWQITGNGKTVNIEVKADSEALVFKAAAGTYKITPAPDGVKADSIIYLKMEKKIIGDFFIWHDDETSTDPKNGNYIYLKYPTVDMDGKPFVSVDTLKNFATDIEQSGNVVTITSGDNKATFTVGSTSYNESGEQKILKNAPQQINGTVYINPLEIAEFLGYTITYNNGGNILNLSKKV